MTTDNPDALGSPFFEERDRQAEAIMAVANAIAANAQAIVELAEQAKRIAVALENPKAPAYPPAQVSWRAKE